MISFFSYSITSLSHKYKKYKFRHTEVSNKTSFSLIENDIYRHSEDSNKTSFSLKENDRVQDYFLYKLCFCYSELIENL